jgi:hypothetical protein
VWSSSFTSTGATVTATPYCILPSTFGLVKSGRPGWARHVAGMRMERKRIVMRTPTEKCPLGTCGRRY